MLLNKLMQQVLHIMEDLIVTFVTIEWEILYCCNEESCSCWFCNQSPTKNLPPDYL